MTDPVRSWLVDVLGPHTTGDFLNVNDRKDDKGQRVRRIECGSRRRWILKEVAVAAEWEAEDHAYRHWVPGMAGLAPTLVASDATLRTLLLSEVPGSPPRPGDLEASRRAGVVLRRLHDAVPPRPTPPSEQERAERRVERLLVESCAVMTPDEQAFVQEQAERLVALGLDQQVPCHGDYRRHNWVVDASGTLRVIDFGKSRWEAPAWDLTKLFLRTWWRRPRLARAFLEGYGRRLGAGEAELVQRRLALDAVAQVAFGARRDSERHVRFGRSRIEDLMGGHDPVRPHVHEAS